jgi:hypothetical protein
MADYGVVLDASGKQVDGAATDRMRGEMRHRRGWSEVPKVQRANPEAAE